MACSSFTLALLLLGIEPCGLHLVIQKHIPEYQVVGPNNHISFKNVAVAFYFGTYRAMGKTLLLPIYHLHLEFGKDIPLLAPTVCVYMAALFISC